MASVTVIGAGSWGTALAALLSRHGHAVRLWGRNRADLAAIDANGRNDRYLPGIQLPTIATEPELDKALAGADYVLLGVPSSGMPEIIESLVGVPELRLIWTCKGLDPVSSRFMHALIEERMPGFDRHALVSGPTFAREVAQG